MGSGTIRSRARHLIAALALALTAFIAVPAAAWGEFGHRTTADVALANVKPETRAAIARLLSYERQIGTPDCALRSLQDAAVWPDCVRREGWRWGFTAAWHYRTAPICEPYNARSNCSGGNCVTGQIERNQRILADESLPPNVRLEALTFLVHFIGDVHMPLHSGDKDDRGGNDRVTEYGIVPGLNLHSIWDSTLAERAITSARPSLIRRYDAAERAEIGGGDPAEWGRESWQLARDFVYPGAFDQDVCAGDLPKEAALSQEGIVAAIPISQRRIIQAGVRMAAMLDEAFAPGPLAVPERRE
ncbi:S1/P1 nuclease [Allopontixanthobacter sediminis]|uniref:Endonuclease n=1 Tax=Allopontixanthobacter sediminis TaxID=1689985 RepID=A0A845B212_9SPHN|nr:S1/P1 nuclease [Allopontixanthobacter sediminis]MXP44164.1 endonuclease [Allopontixanthobacter sediminis]